MADETVESAYQALEAFILGQSEEENPQEAPGDAHSQPEAMTMEVETAGNEVPSTEVKEAPPPPESMETDSVPVAEQGDKAATPVQGEETK